MNACEAGKPLLESARLNEAIGHDGRGREDHAIVGPAWYRVAAARVGVSTPPMEMALRDMLFTNRRFAIRDIWHLGSAGLAHYRTLRASVPVSAIGVRLFDAGET
ncbi:hypothetical protein D3260_01215 [Salinisphaera sp. Q1T1-3]|nr:hypothetical protein D3260_01215 [Salinisphaera sp. Q1T1-3]